MNMPPLAPNCPMQFPAPGEHAIWFGSLELSSVDYMRPSDEHTRKAVACIQAEYWIIVLNKLLQAGGDAEEIVMVIKNAEAWREWGGLVK